MFQAFTAALRRDVLLALRHLSDGLTTVFFFIMVVSLFPLGIGSDRTLLRAIAPGVLWVAALLACLLSLNRLFAQDQVDGTLEQLLISPAPLGLLVLAKVIAHWLTCVLPLVLLSPVLALQFDLPTDSIGTLTASLLLGTPALSLMGAIGAALTLGVRGAGMLTSILVLPLYIPVLVFGTGAVSAQESGLGGGAAYLYLLAALSTGALVFAPWASAAALLVTTD